MFFRFEPREWVIWVVECNKRWELSILFFLEDRQRQREEPIPKCCSFTEPNICYDSEVTRITYLYNLFATSSPA